MSDQYWKVLSDHLYYFEDTCIVYALVHEGEAVLVDFGSGAVLDHLGEIGIHRVQAILHTHHHRYQCQGDQRAVQEGIPIWVPEHERMYFDRAELYWASRQLYDMYNVRNTYFSLTQNVPVAGVLEDFGVWQWGPYEIKVLPTPGHTLGSLTLLVKVDGKTVAFTGDLLYAPGKVVTMYDMQYNYGSVDGVEATILSLRNLSNREPQMICPSHGEAMSDPLLAIHKTRDLLASLFKLMSNGGLPVDEIDLVPVLPHLLAATYACSFFYVICAPNGKALMVDYGAPNYGLFPPANRYFENGERMRFMEHSLDRLRDQYGIRKIEAVLPSHYHDDHINGIPYLQQQFGVECWAYENMREILENPRGELIGCVLPQPIHVQRTFRDGERLTWEGFEFTIHYTPGHADYHMGMFGEIDGHSVAFSGDNIFPLSASVPSLIYRNHVHKTSHQQTAKIYLEYMPDILCTGHDLQREVKPLIYQEFARKSKEMTQLFETLLPGEANFGLEPSWVQIYPYQSLARPGDTLDLQVRMTNFLDRTVQASVTLVLPDQWLTTPKSVALSLAPHARTAEAVKVHILETYQFKYPRVAITADVTFDGRELGQITEATVERSEDS